MKAIRLFVSYSHRDKHFAADLRRHLKVLERSGAIEVWHDRMIPPGAEWQAEIDRNLETADIIIVLLSPDFFESDYCYKNEMRRSLERCDVGEARLIPVIVRSVLWEHSPLGRLQALPEGALPVKEWEHPDRAWRSIVFEILKTAGEVAVPKHVTFPKHVTLGVSEGDLAELAKLEPDVVHKIEEYVRAALDTEKRLERIGEEIRALSACEQPMETVVVQLLVRLTEKHECGLRLKLKEWSAIEAIMEANDRIQKRGGPAKLIEPTEFGLPGKSSVELMRDMKTLTSAHNESLQAMTAVLAEVRDKIMQPIRSLCGELSDAPQGEESGG